MADAEFFWRNMKNNSSITFYAHIINYDERNSYDGRCPVTFEAVVQDEIQMFVTGELPAAFPNTIKESDTFFGLWNHFQRGGLTEPAFVADKAKYLGKATDAEITLMLHSFADTMAIVEAENDWWTIVVYDKVASKAEDACMLQMTGYEWIEEEFAFELRAVSREEEERLYHLYTYYHEPESRKNGHDSVGAVGPNTVFQSVQVLYVGAALCCCLVGAGNNVLGYFDMGKESSYSQKQLQKRNPANYPAMNNEKIQSCQAVLWDAQNIPGLSIMISHWHTDHVQILNEMAVDYVQNGNFAGFWQTAEFIYPGIIQAKGWACTYYANFQSAIQTAGNTHITAAPYQNTDHNGVIYGAQNLTIYKCDRDDTAVGTPNHHDHGIWATVRLNSNRTVFLAGDCAYDTIGVGNAAAPELTNNGSGYHYLVASHHGGKYTHTTAQGKTQYIPRPTPPVSQPMVFYSANGVAYGHPVPANVTAYENAGWNSRYLQTLPGQGNNAFVLS